MLRVGITSHWRRAQIHISLHLPWNNWTHCLFICETYLSIYLFIYLPTYLPIYGSTALVGIGRFFIFLILYTVGGTPWMRDQSVTRPLPTQRTTLTQNKRKETSMPLLEFENTIPIFQRAKTVHAVDSADTVIDNYSIRSAVPYFCEHNGMSPEEKGHIKQFNFNKLLSWDMRGYGKVYEWLSRWLFKFPPRASP
jgi:hypothetical protein